MRFAVRAIRNSGELVTLGLDAADAGEANRLAQAQGLAVLSVDGETRWSERIGGRRQRFNLILFSQELLSLLDAGITIVEALETLQEKEQRPEARNILAQLVAQLHEGIPLSGALQRLPDTFPALYVATVRASERTGDLVQGLTRYIAYAKQLNVVRSKLISASIYPALLIGTGGLVMAFLLGYVVPRFGRIYADMGGNLPFMSRLLLHWGKLVEAYGPHLLVMFCILAFAIWRALASPALRQRALDRVWSIPAVGERLRIYQLARFYRTLGMLIRGGIPVATALDMVAGLLQPTYRSLLAAATQSIREGKPISTAFSDHQLTTPVALRMLRVGERGGRMGEMMERIAAFYDEELALWVEWFTRLFEPLLMAVIGILIGVIVVLMYLPIFELAGGLR